MNSLVVYYSRSGHTRKVAETITGMLKCDVEEIIDIADRSGITGYMRSGFEAMMKKQTILKNAQKDPSKYDLVIIGTPVWALSVSSPVRTYMLQNRDKFKNVAFFCTYGSVGADSTFAQMEEICGKKPIGSLGLRDMDLRNDAGISRIKKFISEIGS
ncbi:MAG: flavodoxin family protein [Caulobacteraceae bacterium]